MDSRRPYWNISFSPQIIDRNDLEENISDVFVSTMPIEGITTAGTRTVGTALWRHQMETFSALLALCVGNSPVTGEFPTKVNDAQL